MSVYGEELSRLFTDQHGGEVGFDSVVSLKTLAKVWHNRVSDAWQELCRMRVEGATDGAMALLVDSLYSVQLQIEAAVWGHEICAPADASPDALLGSLRSQAGAPKDEIPF